MEQSYLWHEQESFKALFEAEMDTLRNGLGDDFQLIKELSPNKSAGQILVWGKLSYGDKRSEDILINFPVTYPYSPPTIRVITPNSTGPESPLPCQVKFFGRGQQYDNGNLCLLRKDAWDKNQFGIGFILRKAQKWLEAATSEKGFSSDQIVEENPSPIPYVGQVLMHKPISPIGQKKGSFFVKEFKQNHFLWLAEDKDISVLDTVSNRKEILPCAWFHIPNVKFKDITSFGFNWQTFPQLVKEHCLEEIASPLVNSDITVVGLYFSQDKQWHFLKLTKLTTVGEQVVGKMTYNMEYLLAKDLSSELNIRVKDLYDVSVLKNKRVAIIGVGAIGSEVASDLVRNGVEHLDLYDFDTFEAGNTARHLADLCYVGEPKVEVVKKVLSKANPSVVINAYPQDILQSTKHLEASIKEADLVLALTADDQVDYFINDIYSKKYNKPFVFARLSKGAFTGIIQVVIAGESGCLRCLNILGDNNPPQPKNDVDMLKELPPEYGSCSLPALPGAGIDTREVALQVSRVSLQLLLRETDSIYPKMMGMQFFWHGPAGSKDHPPFSWEIKNTGIASECTICKS